MRVGQAQPFQQTLHAALLALTSLRRLKKKIDPRRVNGGVFLGLNGTVIKSHGSADETGVAAAVALAAQLGRSGFSDKLAARVASAAALGQDDAAISDVPAAQTAQAARATPTKETSIK
jgi:glycerol-3-phosphate acyltransferase PlsX